MSILADKTDFKALKIISKCLKQLDEIIRSGKLSQNSFHHIWGDIGVRKMDIFHKYCVGYSA